MSHDDQIRLTSTPIEKVKLYVNQRFPRYVLQGLRDVQLQEYLRLAADEIVYQLEAAVYGQHVGTVERTETVTFEIEVPASWWQAFKLDAIKWGNPIFNPDKVKMTKIIRHQRVTLTVDVKDVYPDATIILPDDPWGGPVRVMVHERLSRES